jgi:hypothetical protein
MLKMLTGHGFVPYVVLNQGLAEKSHRCEPANQRKFEEKVQLMYDICTSNGALGDLGNSFWQDHAAYENSSEPFVVTRESVADKLGALAQIVDKNLMRQKVLIGLALPREVCQ